MNVHNALRIGQLCSIEICNEEGLVQRLASRVENISEHGIQLASPIMNRVPLYLTPGEKVRVWFWDQFTSYTFEGEVIKNLNIGLPLVMVKHPERIDRVQKREFVRVQYSLDVYLRWLGEDQEPREMVCRSKDLSGGGVMLVLTKKVNLKKDDRIYLEFEINGKVLKTEGVIVWNDSEMDIDGIMRNTLGIKFTSLTEKERKFLIRSIYRRQIDLRRKGLL